MKNLRDYRDIYYAVLIFIFIVSFTYFTKSFFYDHYLVSKIENLPELLFSHSFVVSVFWIIFLCFSVLCYFLFEKWRLRLLPLFLWAFFFFLNAVFWFANLKFVYFSGKEISPFVSTQTEGVYQMFFNFVFGPIFYFWLIFIFLMSIVFLKFLKNLKKSPIRVLSLFFILGFGVVSLIPFKSSFGNLQEYIVPSSFLSYYMDAHAAEFDGIDEDDFLDKLEKFGIEYDLGRHDISFHERIFDDGDEGFVKTKANILIIFLESFSKDITSIYNPRLPGLTPNLEKMANHPNTTIFNHYYNGSTPTITGLIVQLCSFLPPTGHDEMSEYGTLVNHQLLCLPEMLRSNGYNDSFYLHAVPKSFSNKDKILANMGIEDERIYGQDEISLLTRAEPLSWGYSDHQLYPVFESLIEGAEEPYLGVMTTIDTHIPYTNSKDMVKYPLRSDLDALNAFHSSDHAFGEFWNYFMRSDLKEDTILVVVADHAAFPSIYSGMEELFEESDDKAFYDETLFMLYVPDSILLDSALPDEVDTYSSSLDLSPTLLHILGLNVPNYFEGHSIFYDREEYPSLLGMHEFQLFISQMTEDGERLVDYDDPRGIVDKLDGYEEGEGLNLGEYWLYYQWKRKMLRDGRLWKSWDLVYPRYIAHAAGGIAGLSYTNSLEALDENYANGLRYFEVDLSWTKDDELVLIHDWKKSYMGLFGMADGAPSAAFFEDLEMKDGLSQMTLKDLFDWLDEHQDAKIVTDVKERNLEALEYIAGSGYMGHFVVQVYDEEEIRAAEELGFRDVILTLYKVNYSNERVLEIVREYDLFAVTVNEKRAGDLDFVSDLVEEGAVYVHTINDAEKASALLEAGVTGVYTDFLME